jgi:hypothetical protein
MAAAILAHSGAPNVAAESAKVFRDVE